MIVLSPVTSPTADTTHPLLQLQSDAGEKYFFGKVSEGTQRALSESKIKCSKLDHIFLTGQLDWGSISGLPGLILTIADQGKNSLILHYGTELINYVVSTWRYFVFRFGIQLRTNVLTDRTIYSDKLLTVRSLVVSKAQQSVTFGDENQSSVLQLIISKMFPKHSPTAKYDPSTDPYLNVKLPEYEKAIKYSSTCYEISCNAIRGKFKVEEAQRLGVPKGPMFARLAKGETLTLENGTQVKPEQVLERERHFPRVLVIDIPEMSYLPYMKEKFMDYDCSELGAVYYFIDGVVPFNQELIEFMELFGSNHVEHFVSHPNISPNNLVYMGSTIVMLKLKALQLGCYNLPKTDQILSKEFYECFNKKTPSGMSLVQHEEEHVTSSLKKSKVHIFRKDRDLVLNTYLKGGKLTALNIDPAPMFSCNWRATYDRFIEQLSIPNMSFEKLVTEQQATDNFSKPETKTNVEIITLGTGSALPSKYRNVISTLLKVPYNLGHGNIDMRMVLFDAGENTLGTIRRLFSESRQRQIFRNLKMIYLSHLHADHHLGIVSILKEWYKCNLNDPDSIIYLVTPWQYDRFVREWFYMEDSSLLSKIKYISCEHLINDNYLRRETVPLTVDQYISSLTSSAKKQKNIEIDLESSIRDLDTIRQMYKDLRIQNFQTCRAKHCSWAYSNSISFFTEPASKNSFKVSYSGDTRPNIDKFSKEIGLDSDLLIHEATLDNDLQDDAIKKRHCTLNEAIEVSNEMRARKLILTHFSQRYPKAPQMNDSIEIQAKEFCFAFDGMIVDYEKLGAQRTILPYLDRLFVVERDSDAVDE